MGPVSLTRRNQPISSNNKLVFLTLFQFIMGYQIGSNSGGNSDRTCRKVARVVGKVREASSLVLPKPTGRSIITRYLDEYIHLARCEESCAD